MAGRSSSWKFMPGNLYWVWMCRMIFVLDSMNQSADQPAEGEAVGRTDRRQNGAGAALADPAAGRKRPRDTQRFTQNRRCGDTEVETAQRRRSVEQGQEQRRSRDEQREDGDQPADQCDHVDAIGLKPGQFSRLLSTLSTAVGHTLWFGLRASTQDRHEYRDFS
jgi:hypothetical protein